MAYCDLFRHELDQNTIIDIRDSLNKGLALGVERFKDKIEAVVARSVRAGKPVRRSAKGTSGLWGEQANLLFKE